MMRRRKTWGIWGCQLGSHGIPHTVAIARSKQNKTVPGIWTTRPGMVLPKE